MTCARSAGCSTGTHRHLPRMARIRERLSFTAVFGDILQPTHLLFILIVALVVLGPKRLPEAGRALGRGLRDFKDAVSSDGLNTKHLGFLDEDPPPHEDGPHQATATPPAEPHDRQAVPAHESPASTVGSSSPSSAA